MTLRKIDFRRSWQLACEQFASRVADRDHLRWELGQTKRSLNETLAALRELQADVQARWKAEAELASLYREREIARAKATERDITQPLN